MLVALVVGLIIRIVWVWRQGGFRAAADSPAATGPSTPTYPEVWTRATDNRSPRLARPRDVPRPESPEEVTVWAGLEDFRHTVLIYAPVFWVLLPLAALAFLIQQTITDPTGADVNITINGESVDSWPTYTSSTTDSTTRRRRGSTRRSSNGSRSQNCRLHVRRRCRLGGC